MALCKATPRESTVVQLFHLLVGLEIAVKSDFLDTGLVLTCEPNNITESLTGIYLKRFKI